MKDILIFLCLSCHALFAYSQDHKFLLKDIRFPEDFNNQIIIDVQEDQAGLLWLVTHSGLYRYDGNEIVPFKNRLQPDSWESSITSIFADRQGNLWIGAKNGLTRLNLHTWKPFTIRNPGDSSGPADCDIVTIGQGQDGMIYAGSMDGRLYRVVHDSLQFVFVSPPGEENPYNIPSITFIQAPYPGQIWLGTALGKLVRIGVKDGKLSAPEYFGLEKFKGAYLADAIFHSSGKCLVAVPDNGLYLLDTRNGQWTKITGKDGDLGKEGQVFMEPYGKDEVLIFTNQASVGKNTLFTYHFSTDSITEQIIHFPKYLENNHFVWFKNTGSRVLLSLNDHISALVPAQNLFRTFLSDANALSSIRAIYKSPGGKLYLGSYRDGFLRMDEATGEKEILGRKYVYCILPWNTDSLLLGTEGDGLLWYNTRSDKFSPVLASTAVKGDQRLGQYVTTLTRENDHTILVGTYGGLFELDTRRNTTRSVKRGKLSKNKIEATLKQGNRYLIATQYGLVQWNPATDSLSRFIRGDREGESNRAVYCLAVANGRIWAGTDGEGLLVLDQKGNILRKINRSSGLAADIVFSLLSVNGNQIAGTYEGLSIISSTGKIKNYSRLDQLPVNEFNRAAAFANGDTVYLGTINGVVRFEANKLDNKPQKAPKIPLYITDVSSAGEDGKIRHSYTLAYQKKPGITLRPGTPYFSIGFGGMSENDKSLQYYYRLQDDAQWNTMEQVGRIAFVGMRPGHYHLQVAARLPDGQWTGALLRVPLIVKPAFRQTIWFVLLLILALAALIWIIFRYREKQMEKERLLRLKIAGDLHDEVGSTLAGISMQADMLLHGHRENQDEYLRSIADRGRSAVNTMGDIVWSIDPRNDDHLTLIHRLKQYGEKTLGPAGISIKFMMPANTENPVYMPQKTRQNIMLIYKEALTNICRHAEAGHVQVSFFMEGRYMKLVIADDGKGLPDNHSGGHGLRNMQMRANAIGAQLYFPEAEAGLTIVLQGRI